MTSPDGHPNLLKDYFLQGNNDVLHTCHILCQRTVGATTHFPILFATHQQVINKVMIEHTCNEIFTFCTHVGKRYFDSCNSCGPPISLVETKLSILRYTCFILCRRAANCHACTKSRCLGPAGNPIAWVPETSSSFRTSAIISEFASQFPARLEEMK